LRRAVSPALAGCSWREIKASPRSTVYRADLLYEDDAREADAPPASAIVKVLQGPWDDDPTGLDREVRFYREVLPRISLRHPRLYGADVDEGTGTRTLVLEDLASRYRFPDPRYAWSPGEVESFLPSYARLHVEGEGALSPAGKRGWLMRPWHAGLHGPELREKVADLIAWGVWGPLPGIGELIEDTLGSVGRLATCRPTLLHNDLYPPNVALPRAGRGAPVLVDWEMASWGRPELDLAYLFLQPFRSARRVDRATALACYWEERRVLEGAIPPQSWRDAVQRHADAVLSLALVRVAHRVARRPYPPGSDPAAYWDSMFGVLEESLYRAAARTREVRLAPALERSERSG
jgi:hypothetical protein